MLRDLGAGIALLLSIVSNTALAASTHPDRYQRYDVELMTIGPGEVYWERFGHNAILIRDRTTGTGVTFNFGMFDFNQENFFLNFARGRMTYRAVKYEIGADLAGYQQAGRSVWIQRLNLTRQQKNRLIDHLHWHTEEGNNEYRYHYFDANCSTKVRDALDKALEGALSRHFEQVPATGSQRAFVRQLTAPEPWLFSATLLALGRDVDQAGSRWADFFIPMEMKNALGAAQVSDGVGRSRPLVASTRQLFSGTTVGSKVRSMKPLVISAGIGILLALAIAVGNPRRWSGRILPVAWLLLSGIGGLILAALWLLTDHHAAYWNENLLLLSPVALIAAVGVVRSAPWTRVLLSCLVIMAIAAAATKPWLLFQDNWEVVALVLPVHLAIWRWGQRMNSPSV